jgi:hypothetical protein
VYFDFRSRNLKDCWATVTKWRILGSNTCWP